MIRAFEARYHGPTESLGSRISVRQRHDGRAKYYPFDHAAHTGAFIAAVERYLKEQGISYEGDLQRVYETKRGYIVIAHVRVPS